MYNGYTQIQVGLGCKYTDCISAEDKEPLTTTTTTTTTTNECPVYDIKQSDGEDPVMLEIGECRISLHCHCSQVHSDPGVVAPDKCPVYRSNRSI